MPILQVSRITHRKGLNSDLPSPLAPAELGWAIDERRLYIGNGTLADGAPVVGNTEILTEFSDLLAYTTAYTYQGAAAGYVVQTGVSTVSPVTRSIQARLDDIVVVKQFGATGDGVTDDTDAINRALFQLYCRQTNSQIRRALYFPAGTYKVSNTLLIPPYARIYGDGANSSIIRFSVSTWSANTAFAEGVLVSNAGSYYRSVAAVPATGIAITDTAYWDLLADAEFPAYVARTTDSQQRNPQQGQTLGDGGATRPRDVELADIALETAFAGDGSTIFHDVCLFEQLQRGRCDRVNFLGSLTTAEANADTEALAGVRFANTAAVPCQNITLDGCRMQGLTYGIYADCLVEGFTVSNGWFDTLYQGVVMEPNATAALGEPTGLRIMHNMFDNIYAQGIVIDSCGLNASGYNTFYDVGNHFNGVANPATAIIDINEANNVSIGDLFARQDWPNGDSVTSNLIDTGSKTFATQPGLGYIPNLRLRISNGPSDYMDGIVSTYNNATGALQFTSESISGSGTYTEWSIEPRDIYPRIKLWNTTSESVPASLGFTGSSKISLGTYTRQTGQQQTLQDGVVQTTLFSVDTTLARQDGGYLSFKMDYTISRLTAGANATRIGTLTVVAGGDDSAGDGLVYTDDYTENEQTDVFLAVSESSDIITVQYTAEATGYAGTIYYSIANFA